MISMRPFHPTPAPDEAPGCRLNLREAIRAIRGRQRGRSAMTAGPCAAIIAVISGPVFPPSPSQISIAALSSFSGEWCERTTAVQRARSCCSAGELFCLGNMDRTPLLPRVAGRPSAVCPQAHGTTQTRGVHREDEDFRRLRSSSWIPCLFGFSPSADRASADHAFASQPRLRFLAAARQNPGAAMARQARRQARGRRGLPSTPSATRPGRTVSSGSCPRRLPGQATGNPRRGGGVPTRGGGLPTWR
jgi:hypothetical protein